MNKQQLIAWIESLPDSMEVLPFELSEIEANYGEWQFVPRELGERSASVYKRTVRTKMALRLEFSGTVQADFKRDHFGNEQWSNFRKADQ